MNMPYPMLARGVGKAWLVIFFAFIWGLTLQQPRASSDTFTQKVLPVFERRCLSCHGAKIQRGRLDLRSEAAILRGGSRGAVVIPGNAEKSLLYQFITHQQEPGMPLGLDKLSEADIALIAEWINQLAQQPPVTAAEATPIRPPGVPITEKDKQFWSFQKLATPKRPVVKHPAWVRNAIDAFVLQKLEAQQLLP